MHDPVQVRALRSSEENIWFSWSIVTASLWVFVSVWDVLPCMNVQEDEVHIDI